MTDTIPVVDERRKVTIEDQLRCQQNVNGHLQRIEHILTGSDGTNGLRSDVKTLIRDVEALERWKIQAMTIFAIVQLIVVPIAISLVLHLLP